MNPARFLVSFAIAAILTFGAILALTTVPVATAKSYTVNANPYSANHTLQPTDLWNTYELTASSGQNIAYSMTVTTPGGCAMLLFVRGHNANMNSQYAPKYSQETCAPTYSNSFPVASSDGTEFTLLVATTQNQDVSYTLSASITSPLVPSWVLGLLIFVVIGAVAGGIGALIRARKKRARVPPFVPPGTPGPYPPPYVPQAPPPYPPQQPPPGPPPTPP